MAWQITEQDVLFFVAILVFGLIGYQRGWRRETVSLLFIILGLTFLFLKGGNYLAQLLYQFLFNQPLAQSHPRFVQVTTIVALVVIIGLGYLIGGRRFPKPAIPQDRTLGFFLGAFTGALVAAYLTIFPLSDTQTRVFASGTISSLNVGPYFIANFTAVLIFLIALVVVIVGLVAARTKKK